jgi:non-ribosomal peptide synthetase component F
LLGRVRDSTLDALRHQAVPFAKVVEALRPQRTSVHQTPYMQILFQLRNHPWASGETAGPLRIRPYRFDSGIMEGGELYVDLVRRPGGLQGRIKYSTDLFDEATIDRLADDYVGALTGAPP